MQNPESYVAQGKDNTGAAIQLKPFDTSTIFKAYDYQPKKPLLDSLRKDITLNTEGIRPEDRQLYVTPLTNAYIDEATNARIESNKAKTDIGGERFKSIANKKSEVVDMVSLLQKQSKSVQDLVGKIELDPFSYPPDWKEQVDEWYKLHPLKRGFSPNVQKLPDVDLYDFFVKQGTAEVSGGGTRRNSDGSSKTTAYTKFDPIIAEENWKNIVVPTLNSGTPAANRVVAFMEKKVREQAKLENVDYDKLSPVEKMSTVLKFGHDFYMAAQKGNIKRKSIESSEGADATKVEKINAAGDASANQPFEPVAGYAYKTINKQNTNIIPTGSEITGTTEIVDVVQIPIKGRLGGKNDNFAQINKPIKLKIPGSNDYAIGTVEIITKYSDTNGKWVDQFWATIVDNKGKSTEVLLDAENMRTFKTEYRSDPEEILKKTKNDWKKVAENSELEDPEKLESWNSMDEDRRARLKGAYTRNTRKKKKDVTEADPDEEFKVN